MAATIDYFKANAGSFIYAFLSDADVKLFPAIVNSKRLLQMKQISDGAIWSKWSYNDLLNSIETGLKEEYNMGHRELLLKLAAGENVYGKNGAKLGKTGIGDTQPVDSKTGFPSNLITDPSVVKGYDTTSDGKYAKIWDNNKNKPIGVINQETGQQISVFNESKNAFEAGQSNDTDKKNFWMKASAALPFIQSLIEWLVGLFGGKKTEAWKAGTTQTDGFGPKNAKGQQSANSLELIIPILSIAVLGSQLLKNVGDDNTSE